MAKILLSRVSFQMNIEATVPYLSQIIERFFKVLHIDLFLLEAKKFIKKSYRHT